MLQAKVNYHASVSRFRLVFFLLLIYCLAGCEKEEEIPTPVINSFEPKSGVEGTIVTVIGSNFGKDPVVHFSGISVTLIQASETSVSFAVPQGAKSGDITLRTENGKIAVINETFRVLHPPTITSFEPDHGPVGSEIKIVGTNISSNSVVKIGGNQVTINGSSNDGLTVRVSPIAATGKITIETEDGIAQSTAEFTVDVHKITKIVSQYAVALNINEDLTVSGPGHRVYIEGENFSPILSENIVKLNDTPIPVLPLGVTSTSRLRITMPEGVTSGKLTVTIGSTIVESPHITIPPGSWVKKKSLPSVRNRPVAFTINNLKAYVGTGIENATYLTDFWEYDPLNDSWSKKADFGGVGRYNALAFSINGKGYVGMGTGSGVGLLLDFWEYDPLSNTWLKKNDMPYAGASRGAFGINDNGYFIAGVGSEVCEYNHENDSWNKKQNFSGYRFDAISVSAGNRAYYGTGYTNYDNNLIYYQDFWEYNSITNQWTKKADFPGQARTYCIAFYLKGKIYVGAGRNINNHEPEDFWVYDPETNQWSQSVPILMPYGYKATYFTLGDKGYFITSSGVVWEFNPE